MKRMHYLHFDNLSAYVYLPHAHGVVVSSSL
jgi:hypothetical protein